jgi:hypothetical protein
MFAVGQAGDVPVVVVVSPFGDPGVDLARPGSVEVDVGAAAFLRAVAHDRDTRTFELEAGFGPGAGR